VLISAALVMTPLVMLIPWGIVSLSRRRRDGEGGRDGFWWMKTFLLLCALALVLPAIGVRTVSDRELGTFNVWTAAMFSGSVLLPVAAIVSFLFTIDAWRRDAGRWLGSYAMAVSVAALIVSGYLSAWGMIGFRPWNF
jgi:hypothetical protein